MKLNFPLNITGLKLWLIAGFLLLTSACSSEEEPIPTFPGPIIEAAFEERIKGTWFGLEYYYEYFNEDGEFLFKRTEKVFIHKITIDENYITFDYVNSSPDWPNSYSTKTIEGENYIELLGFPDLHVIELTSKLMVWEETTEGGSFNDNQGNPQVEADHQVRTFKFFR